MSAATFDTYAAVKTLREAGADEAMAEAIVNTASAAASADRADIAGFATKADLAEVRADLAEVRNELRADIHRKIETLRSEMRWMFGFQAALILAIAAKLFGIV